MVTRQGLGIAAAAGSAAAFAGMTIFGKYAFDARVNVPTLMFGRFLVAATIFGAILMTRPGRRRLRPRAIAGGLALGGVVYALQAALVFTSLDRIDAGLAILLFYIHPALIVGGAAMLGRERVDRSRILALLLAFVGLVLLLATGSERSLEAVGVLLALGAAGVYCVYLLLCDSTVRDLDPVALATLVCAGALATYTVVGSAGGLLDFDIAGAGFGWTVAVGLVTVAGIGGVLAALPLIGPSRVSIISTLEPALTVVAAFVLFDESLGWAQVAGGGLVLAAILVLEGRDRALTTRAAGP